MKGAMSQRMQEKLEKAGSKFDPEPPVRNDFSLVRSSDLLDDSPAIFA